MTVVEDAVGGARAAFRTRAPGRAANRKRLEMALADIESRVENVRRGHKGRDQLTSKPNSALTTGEKSATSEMSDPDSGTPWLDVRGAAGRVLCSEATVLREAREGRLRGYKIGGRRCWRFRAEDVDRWLMQTAEPVEYEPQLRDVRTR